jgi:hypothetical protein
VMKSSEHCRNVPGSAEHMYGQRREAVHLAGGCGPRGRDVTPLVKSDAARGPRGCRINKHAWTSGPFSETVVHSAVDVLSPC